MVAEYLAGLVDSDLGLPHVPEWAQPSWHLFVVRSKHRAELMAALGKAGIGSLIHYPIPPHKQAAYADLGLADASFPVAEQLADEVVSLPMGPHLAPAQCREVIQATLEHTKAGRAA